MADNQRPWFGPKRIGFGLRPQTWQGWAVTGGLVAVILIVSLVLAGH